MQLIRLRLELCKLLILGGSNCDVQLDQLAVTDRWEKGLIESAVNVARSYPGFPRRIGMGELIAGARHGQRSGTNRTASMTANNRN